VDRLVYGIKKIGWNDFKMIFFAAVKINLRMEEAGLFKCSFHK
jgi:hypothetical protein